MIKDFARHLVEGKATQMDIIPKMCEICKKIKAEEVVCQIHKDKDNIPLNCNACMDSNSDTS